MKPTISHIIALSAIALLATVSGCRKDNKATSNPSPTILSPDTLIITADSVEMLRWYDKSLEALVIDGIANNGHHCHFELNVLGDDASAATSHSNMENTDFMTDQTIKINGPIPGIFYFGPPNNPVIHTVVFNDPGNDMLGAKYITVNFNDKTCMMLDLSDPADAIPYNKNIGTLRTELIKMAEEFNDYSPLQTGDQNTYSSSSITFQ